MKQIHFALFFVTFAMTSFAQTQKVISSSITFKIKNAGFNVSGIFQGFNGSINFDPNDLPNSFLAATIDARTLDTDNNLRNRHLKEKEEFFDVAKYPSIEMKSTKLEKSGDTYIGTFDLKMKNVAKSIKVPFTVTQTGNGLLFKSTFTINRRDWNIGGSSWMMSDNVTLSIVANAQK